MFAESTGHGWTSDSETGGNVPELCRGGKESHSYHFQVPGGHGDRRQECRWAQGEQ